MKFELKTENDNFSKSFSFVLRTILKLALIIIFFDISLKLRIISTLYRIEYNCKILTVQKSKPNFQELSRLSNLKSKQKILEFCREFVK